MLQSSDIRMRGIKGNSILSFNTAAQFPIDFVEFDIQVTKDDCPVIFHDSFIVSEDKDVFIEKRVTDLKLPKFLSYGPQKQLREVIINVDLFVFILIFLYLWIFCGIEV